MSSVIGSWQRAAVLAGVVACAVGGAYVAGKHAGQRDAHVQAIKDSLHNNAHALGRSAAALDTAQRSVASAAKVDTIVRVRYVQAERQLAIVNDSQVRVDSAPPVTVPPPIIATIRAADTVIAVDSALIKRQAAEIALLWHRDTLHVQRETLLEHEIATIKPERCGKKCGFVLGAIAVYGVTHPKQVAAAFKWVVRLP